MKHYKHHPPSVIWNYFIGFNVKYRVLFFLNVFSFCGILHYLMHCNFTLFFTLLHKSNVISLNSQDK